MGRDRQQQVDRAARVEAMRNAQKNADRRRNAVIAGVTIGVCLALVAAVMVVIFRERDRTSELRAAAEQPIDGVQEFEDLERDHVPGPVDYEQTPPVGGPHSPVWANCGVYENPITNEEAVHSLEHGAVWVTYDPELPAEQVESLTSQVGARSYGLLSPFPDLPSPVVASAWGLQLELESADDPRLEVFLTKYLQGDQTPEPGAACTGGRDQS